MQYKNGLIRGVHSLEGDNSEILDHLSASGGRGLTREGTTVHVLYRNLFYTDVRDRPFNLKGRFMVIFLKKYSDSQWC